MVAGRLEDRADLPDRVRQLVVPAAVERRGPAVRCHQPEQHPQGRGLAGSVGSEQGRHLARLCHRADVVDGQHVPEDLGEAAQLDAHHASSAMRAAPRATWRAAMIADPDWQGLR